MPLDSKTTTALEAPIMITIISPQTHKEVRDPPSTNKTTLMVILEIVEEEKMLLVIVKVIAVEVENKETKGASIITRAGQLEAVPTKMDATQSSIIIVAQATQMVGVGIMVLLRAIEIQQRASAKIETIIKMVVGIITTGVCQVEVQITKIKCPTSSTKHPFVAILRNTALAV